MFCYLGNLIGARRGQLTVFLTSIRSGGSKFRDLVPLLATRGLLLAAKGRLYSACGHSIMLYESCT